jgi:hypothetical protein
VAQNKKADATGASGFFLPRLRSRDRVPVRRIDPTDTLMIATRRREMDRVEDIPRKSAAVARELFMVTVAGDM